MPRLKKANKNKKRTAPIKDRQAARLLKIEKKKRLQQRLHALILNERYDEAIDLHKQGAEIEIFFKDPERVVKNAENTTEAEKYLKFYFKLDPKYSSDEWFGKILRTMIIELKTLPFDLLQVCIDHGLNINKPYQIYDRKKPRLDYFLIAAFKEIGAGINMTRCNEVAIKICEMGADPNVEDHYLVRIFLRNKNFDDAKRLMAYGVDLNNKPAEFFTNILRDLIDNDGNKQSDPYTHGIRMINFCIRHLDCPCNVLLSFQNEIRSTFKDRENLLRRYLDNMLKNSTKDIDLPDTLETSAFLKKSEQGFRVIDGLAIQGRLKEVFDQARWHGRERDGIALYEHVRPEFQNHNMIAALKLYARKTPQKSSSGIRRRPKNF